MRSLHLRHSKIPKLIMYDLKTFWNFPMALDFLDMGRVGRSGIRYRPFLLRYHETLVLSLTFSAGYEKP